MSRYVLVGDQLCDVEAAWSAGCRAVLVLSGRGSKAPVVVRGEPEVAADRNASVHLIVESARHADSGA